MNAFDVSGIPTTLAIIGVVVLLVIALRSFNKKFPQVAVKIKDATPWMGWIEKEPVTPIITMTRHPRNHW